MFTHAHVKPIDYLVVGHFALDKDGESYRLGGTAAYAALTARSLGLRVGIVTSWAEELPLGSLAEIPIVNFPAERSTTFVNEYTPTGRRQRLLSLAATLDFHLIPEVWRNVPIIHLGPIAQEVSPSIMRHYQDGYLCITPQGWLREWDEDGSILHGDWVERNFVLQRADAVVISEEDVGGDQGLIESMAQNCALLIVTAGSRGVYVHHAGEVSHFEAPSYSEVDPTGAGDVFAAVFFISMYQKRTLPEAVRFANQAAAISVTRKGLKGIPQSDELLALMAEVH